VQATEQKSPFCLPPAIANMVPQFWHLCCFAENKTARHGSQYLALPFAANMQPHSRHLFCTPLSYLCLAFFFLHAAHDRIAHPFAVLPVGPEQ
jgi:hypothetical protein